jgi:hypothetical protein
MKKTDDDLLVLRAHNPIPEQPDPEWVNGPQGRELFARIEAGTTAEPHVRHKRARWQRPTVTIPVLVVLTGTALLVASAGAGDKVIAVSAEDALADPSRIERQLAEEGIRADVRAVPVKDALLGKWFHLYVDPRADVDASTFALLKTYVGEIDYRYESVAQQCGDTGAACERTAVLEIPGSVEGPITLVAGRAPKAGEEYWARHIDWGNELAPSGALYCYALEEKSPEAARDLLLAAGYAGVVFNYDVENRTSTDVESVPPDAALTSATFKDVDTVVLTFAPVEGSSGYPSADEQRRSVGTPTARTGRPDFGVC